MSFSLSTRVSSELAWKETVKWFDLMKVSLDLVSATIGLILKTFKSRSTLADQRSILHLCSHRFTLIDKATFPKEMHANILTPKYIIVSTWKQWIVSLREECTSCRSTAWGIQTFRWYSFGFQYSSCQSARSIFWKDDVTFIYIKDFHDALLWKSPRYLYWCMLLQTGKATGKWL